MDLTGLSKRLLLPEVARQWQIICAQEKQQRIEELEQTLAAKRREYMDAALLRIASQPHG